MAKVKGIDVVLKYSDDMFPFLCARSIEFDINQDLIETSIKGSNRYRTYIPGAITWGGTLEGLAYISGGTTDGDMSIMYDLLQTKGLFQIEWYEEDTDHVYWLKKSGYAYLESMSEVASFDNITTFNATFKGSGEIIITAGLV